MCCNPMKPCSCGSAVHTTQCFPWHDWEAVDGCKSVTWPLQVACIQHACVQCLLRPCLHRTHCRLAGTLACMAVAQRTPWLKNFRCAASQPPSRSSTLHAFFTLGSLLRFCAARSTGLQA